MGRRVRVTPWKKLSQSLRDNLSCSQAEWLQHPLAGYSLFLVLRAFELGKSMGFGLKALRV